MGTKKIVTRILAILLIVFLAESASAQMWGDGWWNPSESGWGINVIHQGDTMFVCLYVYGEDGSPNWYSATLYAGSVNASGYNTYQGQLTATTGPWFGVWTYNPESVSLREVGSMTFSPSSPYQAQLSYSVDGVMVSKGIERFTFRLLPLSGFYHGGLVVNFNNCEFGGPAGDYETISMDISQTVTPGSASGQITVDIYENDYYSCTITGTYLQSGAVVEAVTDDCVSLGYVQVTDFIPTETAFRADSVVYGPDGCTAIYSMSGVKVY
jgi:hypothetical protein